MKAGDTLKKAAALVGGKRASQHGDMHENFENIARLWSAYLRSYGSFVLAPENVAQMMVLLKMARTLTGELNEDDYEDEAGYVGIAAETRNL